MKNSILKIILLFSSIFNASNVIFSNSFKIYVGFSDNASDTNSGKDTLNSLKTLHGAYTAIPITLKHTYEILLNGNVALGDNMGTFQWMKSGNDSCKIIIKSFNSTNPAKIIRNETYDPNLNTNEDIYINFIKVSNLEISDIEFNDAANCLYLSSSSNCIISGCKFQINDFVVSGGAGAIVLDGKEKDETNEYLKCRNNIIKDNYIEFTEKVLYTVSVFETGDIDTKRFIKY